MRSLNEKGLAARTAHYSYSVLRRALQFAVDWKYIPANPASSRMLAAKRRQVKELSKIRFLTPDESRAFLNAVRGDRYAALYVLAITTGMRQGEMLGLQWPDLDLDLGKLTISRSLHRTKRRRDPANPEPWFQLRHPKTAGSRRTIDIPPVTVDALRDHQVRQREQRLLAGSSWQEQKLIFTTRTGTPVDTTNVLHQFRQILKSASASPEMRFNDLRHTPCFAVDRRRSAPKENRRAPRPRLHKTDDGSVWTPVRGFGQRIGGAHAEDLWESLSESPCGSE